MPDYLISTRGLRKKKFTDEPGPTQFLEVPSGLPSPTHQIARTAFINAVIGPNYNPTRSDVLFFIHGYNVTQADLIARHRDISSGLIQPFAAVVKSGCRINLQLLAHSTGAFIIREAFDDADDRDRIARTNWSVSQIAFVAADISSSSMTATDSHASSLYRHCVRLTNYYNPYDSVLKLSKVKRIGVSPRAGRVGLPAVIPSKAPCPEIWTGW
jgi:esterase/lipase superfamily enzyme